MTTRSKHRALSWFVTLMMLNSGIWLGGQSRRNL